MAPQTRLRLNSELVSKLENMKEEGQDLNQVIETLINNQSKTKTNKFIAKTKISKSDTTLSTVIPSPIKTKFGLDKGQVLFWDIKENKIIISLD